MLSTKDILSTYQQIRAEINRTPLVYAPVLSKISSAEVFLTLEHLQVSGSFKIRGVLSKMNRIGPPRNM